jgi:hypothetical protein
VCGEYTREMSDINAMTSGTARGADCVEENLSTS